MNNDVDEIIHNLLDKYSETRKPIEISFRDVVPDMVCSNRFTHLIHAYPAKLLPNIPYFFLSTDYFCPKGGLVLDPFCGTGTVLLESILSGRKAIGADSNPIARLISAAKTCYVNSDVLHNELKRINERAKESNNQQIPDFPNRDFWFSNHVQRQITNLLYAINKSKKKELRAFFLVCLSNIIKKVSYADPRVYVPVKLNPDRFADKPNLYQKIRIKIDSLRDVDVYEKFSNVCKENIERVNALGNSLAKFSESKVISADARKLTLDLQSNSLLEDESVDLVLTSPPYAGAQKYIRSSRLSLNWFGYGSAANIRTLEQSSIGREDFPKKCLVVEQTGIRDADLLIEEIATIDIVRACIVSTYLNEMKDALKESVRVLKKNGYLILVVGPNKVCKYTFDTPSFLSSILEDMGLYKELELIDKIKTYGLMVKRNVSADRILVEKILVFRK